MNTPRIHFALSSSLLALALFAGAPARAASLDDDLAALDAASPRDYVALRDRLVVTPSRDALAARVASARYSASTWRTDAMALALMAHVDDPDAARALDGLVGLDPAHYRALRRPEPVVGRELVTRQVAPGLLVEALLKTADLRAYHDVAREAPAYRNGLLYALARSGHPVALPLLADAAARAASLDERATATSLLGSLGASAAPALVALFHAPATPSEQRPVILVGLSQTRTRAALAILVDVARTAPDDAQRDAAIRGLGNVGDRWAHAAAPSSDSEAVRADATAALVDILAQYPERAELVALSLAMIAHPSAAPALDALVAKGGPVGEAAALVKRRVARALDRAAR